MTIWFPNLGNRPGPRYLAIADAIADDIRLGRLNAGQRLPTHRDLAYRLGTTVGTVTRAYAEAERRGLIGGEVGRGTFVRRPQPPGRSTLPLSPATVKAIPGAIDFSFNLPHPGAAAARMGEALTALATDPALTELLAYQPELGHDRHRQAGATLISRSGLEAPAERIAVCNGAQHAMDVVFGAIAGPGDLILTEDLSYPGVVTLAKELRLRLQGLPMDDDGLRPDAFAEACRTAAPKALYCLPDLQNPTTAVMPIERRREIADIARDYGVVIIEDDVYGFLLAERPPPLSVFAPELSYYVTSVSKSIAPGLRVGYALGPPDSGGRLAMSLQRSCRMATPLMAEIVGRWIADGTADALAAAQRDEIRARQAIAREILADTAYRTRPESYHLWLSLPEPWRADAFVERARGRGVLLTPADVFAIGRGAPHAVRICIGGVPDRDDVGRGLAIVMQTLHERPRPHLAVV